MMHDMEIDMAYDAGIEQNKVEMIKNLKDKLSIEEIADVAKVSVERVKEIIDAK